MPGIPILRFAQGDKRIGELDAGWPEAKSERLRAGCWMPAVIFAAARRAIRKDTNNVE
jgi:hypothetical protein